MQNAWRFVDDAVLRGRPEGGQGHWHAIDHERRSSAELKKQGFLVAQGKHIVPTEAGVFACSVFSNRPTQPWSIRG